MLDCKRVLDGVKAELYVLDVKDIDPDVIQTHLDKCMVKQLLVDYYKILTFFWKTMHLNFLNVNPFVKNYTFCSLLCPDWKKCCCNLLQYTELLLAKGL